MSEYNILRPARPADDERLFPAGYVESVSSTHALNLADSLIPLGDLVSASVKKESKLTDLFTPFYDAIETAKIKSPTLIDDFSIMSDVENKTTLSTIADIIQIADARKESRTRTFIYREEDSAILFDGSRKTEKKTLEDNIVSLQDLIADAGKTVTALLQDSLIPLTDIADIKKITTAILFDAMPIVFDKAKKTVFVKLPDSTLFNDSVKKELKKCFEEDAVVFAEHDTQRYHWVCVYSLSEIKDIAGIAVSDPFFYVDEINSAHEDSVCCASSISGSVFFSTDIDKMEDE